ncbi:MAG: MFS transporter [Candidatus Nanopelagicales bacterium]
MQRVEVAKRAVSVVFILQGLGFASWASRIPQVQEQLDLSPAQLGFVLLSIAAGCLVALPTAGMVVHRFGAARTTAVTVTIFCGGITLAAIGTNIGVLVVVIGLVLMGIGTGAGDVAMNVEGAAVEQELGRSVMPRFHAGFSVGTVTGALLGIIANVLDLSVAIHLSIIAVIILVVSLIAIRKYLPAGSEEHDAGERGHPMAAWKEPRTLLIGVFLFALAFSEGTGNEWVGVAAVDSFAATAAMASATYFVFVVAMTTVRWFGSGILDRFGRVRTMRVSILISIGGVLLVVFAPALWVVMVGCVFWALGTGLGFPVGMSSAADDPAKAAGRVSAVASIGYLAFLTGPAIVGIIAEYTGVLRSLSVTAVLLVIGFLVVGATKPLPGASDGAH